MKFNPRAGEPVPINHRGGLPYFRWQDEAAVLELIATRRVGSCYIQGAPKTEPPPSIQAFADACARRARR